MDHGIPVGIKPKTEDRRIKTELNPEREELGKREAKEEKSEKDVGSSFSRNSKGR